MIKRWMRKIKLWYIQKQVVHRDDVAQDIGEPKWYGFAKVEWGVKEIYGKKHNPRVLEYHASTGGFDTDEVAWCSSFVNWCIAKAGVRGTRKANARSWMNWGVATNNPQIGDIVVFYRGKKSGWMGHVGFYAGERGGKILVLGGNQNNSVCYQYYGKSKLLGYRKLKE